MNNNALLRKISNGIQDRAVWIEIAANGGATAYYISNYLNIERSVVSAALQRLKRKGKVVNEGNYWRLSPSPDP